MPADHLIRGQAGEDLVADHLSALGHEILERNWRGHGGEIDLITVCEDVLHFVEVKTRSTDAVGGVWEAVPPAKQRKIVRTAEAFLMGFEHGGGMVFSVAFVHRGGEGGEYVVEFLEDAVDGVR